MVATFPSSPTYLFLESCKKISFSWCFQDPTHKKKYYKKPPKNPLAKQLPKAGKTQELQNSSHLLFTNCCFLVLTIAPLKGNHKAPRQWRCTLECPFVPHMEAKRDSLVIWRFCPNAQRHEIPPTKHQLRYVSVALTLHLSLSAFQVVF